MINYESEGITYLTALGFGEYEARVYVALLTHGPLSGYEVSKQAGVPRPNVYPVLQRLEDRGAVVAFAARRGATYAARPPGELLTGLERTYGERLRGAGAALSHLARADAEPVALAVAGEDELLARARRLIDGATEQVVLAVAPLTAGLMVEATDRAIARGVQVTTQCVSACPEPCAACRGALFRHAAGGPVQDHWFLIVVDDRELVAADLAQPGRAATGVATRHPALVRMAVSSVRDGIAVAEIVRSLGTGVLDAVDLTSGATLSGIALADSHRRSWLERVRARLAGGH